MPSGAEEVWKLLDTISDVSLSMIPTRILPSHVTSSASLGVCDGGGGGGRDEEELLIPIRRWGAVSRDASICRDTEMV